LALMCYNVTRGIKAVGRVVKWLKFAKSAVKVKLLAFWSVTLILKLKEDGVRTSRG